MFLLVYDLIKNLHNFLGFRISIASHYIINETFFCDGLVAISVFLGRNFRGFEKIQGIDGS